MGYMGYKNSRISLVLLSQRFQALKTVTQEVVFHRLHWVTIGYKIGCNLLKRIIRSLIPHHYFLDYHWFHHH